MHASIVNNNPVLRSNPFVNGSRSNSRSNSADRCSHPSNQSIIEMLRRVAKERQFHHRYEQFRIAITNIKDCTTEIRTKQDARQIEGVKGQILLFIDRHLRGENVLNSAGNGRQNNSNSLIQCVFCSKVEV